MSTPASTQNSPAAAARRGARRWGPPRLWMVMGLPLVVLCGSCIVVQTPREIGRWKLAAALDLRGEGRREEAYSQLDEALRWFPDSPILFLQRAEWRLADGDKAAAVADAERLLAVVKDDYEWLVVHSHVMQTIGEFGRAVENWKRIDRESQRTGRPDRATALNGLAYARALAESEIDEAIENVNEALELDPGNEAILDTRGFLLYLKGGTGSLAVALKDLNEAVEKMDQKVAGIPRTIKEKWNPAAKFNVWQSRPKMWSEALPDVRRDREAALKSALRSAAVLHYHRALIFEALGRTAGAEADRDAARKLIGKEPDETLF